MRPYRFVLAACILAGLPARTLAQAPNVSVTITADNAYAFGWGPKTGLTTYNGGVINSHSGDIFNCSTGPEPYQVVGAGANDYLYIVGWSDDSSTQGVLGQFKTSGGATIYTGQGAWEVYATGINFDDTSPTLNDVNAQIAIANVAGGDPATTSVGWVGTAATTGREGVLEIGQDNTTPYGGTCANAFPIVCPPSSGQPNSIDGEARWMWYRRPGAACAFLGGNHREFLIFRLPIAELSAIRSGILKDFCNNTGQPSDGIEIVLAGSCNVITHYDGPVPGQPNTTFTSFTVTHSGPNTILRWSGGYTVPPGGKVHIGFTVDTSPVTILAVRWTVGGTIVACANQVSVRGTSTKLGKVIFKNSLSFCSPPTLNVSNLIAEWLSSQASLTEMSPEAVRHPIRVDLVQGLPVGVDPEDSTTVDIPLPPPDAKYVLFSFDVSPFLNDPCATKDVVQVLISSEEDVEHEVNHDTDIWGLPEPAAVCAPGDTTWIADFPFDSPGCSNTYSWTVGGLAPGPFARLFSHITDNDKCTENTTCAWLFTDPSYTVCSPELSFGPAGAGVRSGTDGFVVSPWVGLGTTPAATGTNLSFRVFPGNCFQSSRIVMNWAVRTRTREDNTNTSTPGDSIDLVSAWNNHCWNSSSLWTWVSRVMDLTPEIDPGARDVQVRFRVADWGPLGLQCATTPGSCPGPGPYLDRVRIGRRVVPGPVISEGCDSRSQAQDAFPTIQNAITPGEHFSPSTSRVGACAFSRAGDLACCGSSPNVITGDSIVVNVVDSRGAGGITAVGWCGSIIAGPHAGKSPAPYAIGANGFFCLAADSVRDANGVPVANHWFVDLDDTYFRGGDQMVYYWWATDANSGFTSDPCGLNGPPPSVAAAEASTRGLLEVSYLPTMNWAPAYRARILADPHGDLDPTPSEIAGSPQASCLLYVQMENSRRRSGPINRTSFMFTLDVLGYKDHYDVYDLQGIGNTNNHLGGRAQVAQATGYALIVQDTGRRRTAVLPDGLDLDSEKVNQAQWYRNYLAAAATSEIGVGSLWFIGENIVEKKSTNALFTDAGVTLVSKDQGLSLHPDVQGQSSFTWANGCNTVFTGDKFALEGGCPVRRDYDGLGTANTAVATHKYKFGTLTGSAAIVMNKSAVGKWNTIVMAFGWPDIRDASGSPPGVPEQVLAGKILACTLPVGCQRSPQVTGAPPGADLPRVSALYQNTPNPFNPTTHIAFDLARDGHVMLRIFTVGGRLVRTLVNGPMPRQHHVLVWDGKDGAGHQVPSGIYLYRLETEDFTSARKLVVLR